MDSQVEENEVKTKLERGTVSEEKMLGKKMKVKVREFIKRFNPEGSPKRDLKMRKKDKNKIRGEDQGHLSPSVSESNGEGKSAELKFEEAFVFASSQSSQVCFFLAKFTVLYQLFFIISVFGIIASCLVLS